MKRPNIPPGYLLVSVFALALGTGCATKGYVRNTVGPVDQRVTEVEQKSADNSTKIEELESQVERDISRLDERTMSNERNANAAAEQAQSAGKRADQAHGLAETGLARVEGLERAVDEVVENMDDYRLVAGESVLFAFNSSQLTEEAKETLDSAAARLNGYQRYVVEVRGFTDSSGSKEYNLALSRKRADAVVRYLTLSKNIPLHRIHVVGLGDEVPASDNKTREGRQQNRRVELKFFVADIKGPGSAS